jgi:hypothetical protein
MNRYGKYANRRKYELLDASIYSVVNCNEADTVLNEWATMVADAQKIHDSLPANAQPGFFELVLHPCKAGYILYQLYVNTAKNNLYAKQNRVGAAVLSVHTLQIRHLPPLTTSCLEGNGII